MDIRKGIRGERAKRMMDTNENLHGIESNIIEDQKWDEHIRTIELFCLLLQQQPKEDGFNEEGVEITDETGYMFPVVLQLGISHGYDEDGFVSQMLNFKKAGYVTLSSVNEEEDLDQLIRDKLYDKIQICLNESQMLHALLNDSLTLNKSMRNLAIMLQKQKPVWESYDRSRQEMTRQHQEMEKWHEELTSMKESWEEEIKTDQKNREQEAKDLKIEVESITKEKVDGQLEEELKLSGKIGAAMQDMQKDIIQFMGIFIAIFALLGLNISNAGKWSTADFFHINLVITASMATMLFLISVIMKGKSPRTSCMGILTAVLWVTSAFVFFVFPYLKDEIISFWGIYYK